MATVWNLLATQVPAIQVPAALIDPATATPTNSPYIALGDTLALVTKNQQQAVRLDMASLYGGAGGAYAVAEGLELTAGSGLTLNISAGRALIAGLVAKAADTKALSNGVNTSIWLSQAGTITPVIGSTTPPPGIQCYLGRVTTAGGVITVIDYSGRVESKGGLLYRRTADVAAPLDTPPAGIRFLQQTLGGLYYWNGIAYTAFYAAPAAPYYVSGYHHGIPTASKHIWRHTFVEAVDFAAGLPGSRANARVGTSLASTFDLQKNGVSIGSIGWAGGGSTNCLPSIGSPVSFAVGDVLAVIAPGSPDATLADISFTLVGTAA